jgi:hypothetical protein
MFEFFRPRNSVRTNELEDQTFGELPKSSQLASLPSLNSGRWKDGKSLSINLSRGRWKDGKSLSINLSRAICLTCIARMVHYRYSYRTARSKAKQKQRAERRRGFVTNERYSLLGWWTERYAFFNVQAAVTVYVETTPDAKKARQSIHIWQIKAKNIQSNPTQTSIPPWRSSSLLSLSRKY